MMPRFVGFRTTVSHVSTAVVETHRTGCVSISYEEMAGRVRSVRIRNVASYVVEWEIAIDVLDFGHINVDVAYGGNYYAIVRKGLIAGLTHSVSRASWRFRLW